MLKKFERFPLYIECMILTWFEFWSDKNPFGGPKKNWTATLHIVTFVWKNVQNGGASLDSFLNASWLHACKFLNHLELYNIFEKK